MLVYAGLKLTPIQGPPWPDAPSSSQSSRASRPAPRLDGNRQQQVLSRFKPWPGEFGFATELWNAPGVAHLIWQKLGVSYLPRYLGIR